MTRVYIINLDDKILKGKPDSTKRIRFIDKNTVKTISGIIDYFMEENDASIAELGYIENSKRIGIIIPKPGTKIGYDFGKRIGIIIPKPGTKIGYNSLIIDRSVIVTFDKTKGNNKNLKIYENKINYKLREIINNTIKNGEFIKSETMPKEFVKYIH